MSEFENYHVAEREAIIEATQRLTASTGPKPTIDSLCREAGLAGRWILTHRHVDLKDSFLAAVAEKWGPGAPGTVAAKSKLDELQAKYDRLSKRAAQLDALVDSYAAVIDQLSHEIETLQQMVSEATNADGKVTQIRR